MILEQFYLGCLAQASYVIGDPEAGRAAVVDPRRDVDDYVRFAEAHGLRIEWILLTHLHADFVSGHIELARRTGARIALGHAAKATYEHRALHEGDRIEVGRAVIDVMETPGHTPESLSYVVRETKDAAPHGVLTGDTLFIGDVGRPDLTASEGMTSEELAGLLFDSLHQKIMSLPDETLVYPGHGAGSMCGKNMSTETVSTIGKQRTTNYALAFSAKDDFIASVTSCQPTAPRHFARDAHLNRSDRGLLEDAVAQGDRALGLDDVLREMNAGAQLLDTRFMDDFAAGHLAGAINIGLDGQFATWSGALLDADRSIVLLTPKGHERETVVRLSRVGLDSVIGYLADGPDVIASRPELLVKQSRIAVTELARRLEGGQGDEDIRVLDIRGPGEWVDGHLEGATHLPLPLLPDHLDDVPRDQTVYVHCLSGYRSSAAVSLLRGSGFDRVVDVVGGFEAWVGEGQRVVEATV